MFVPPDVFVTTDCGDVGWITNIHQRGLQNQSRCLCRRDCVAGICVSSLPTAPAQPEVCDKVLTPENIKSVGILLADVGLCVGLCGGFSGALMLDKNDIGANAERQVIVGTIYTGVGLNFEIEVSEVMEVARFGLSHIYNEPECVKGLQQLCLKD